MFLVAILKAHNLTAALVLYECRVQAVGSRVSFVKCGMTVANEAPENPLASYRKGGRRKRGRYRFAGFDFYQRRVHALSNRSVSRLAVQIKSTIQTCGSNQISDSTNQQVEKQSTITGVDIHGSITATSY